jgi:hypothetical protein
MFDILLLLAHIKSKSQCRFCSLSIDRNIVHVKMPCPPNYLNMQLSSSRALSQKAFRVH